MFSNSKMGRAVHLLVCSMCFFVFCEAKGYFPRLRDFAEKSSIKSSSTCGETETKYCDATTLVRSVCGTEKTCKYSCCTTCSKDSPIARNLAADKRTYIDIYEGKPRPGSMQNSLGFDGNRGSYIEVLRLPSVEHKTKGFTVCVWVNQTLGNKG